MDIRDTGQYIGYTAAATALVAAFTVPANLLVVAEIGVMISNPGEMAGAARDWKSVAAKVEGLKTELEGLANGVSPEQWQGKDRDAFDHAVQKYKAELTKAHDYHGSVGDMLDTVSWVFFGMAVFALALAVITLAQALAIDAAAGSIIGLPVAAALEAEANGFSAWVAAILSTTAGRVLAMLAIVELILSSGTMTGKQQMTGGNPPTFQQATLTFGNTQIPTLGTSGPALPSTA